MSLSVGQQLLHYRLDAKIGEGGMGVVYEATDSRLGRKVALKVLSAELTQDSERRIRFEQEARLAASFNHPNIATVHDVGEQGGVTFIVMELVRGESLRSLVRQEPLSVERALEIATGIAAGLAKAHREGVLHRDLKPDNVMLTEEGIPKILDFGLSKLVGQPSDSEQALPDSSEVVTATALVSPSLTKDGEVVGTLSYMSPEQLQGHPIDSRADIFAFGALLYELLSGRRPFSGKSNMDTAAAILRDEPAPLDPLQKTLPPGLEAILSRCLAKEPEARFAHGAELHDALVALEHDLHPSPADSPAQLKHPGWLALAVLAVIGLGIAGIWFGVRDTKLSWARNEALPEIERLYDSGDKDGAMRLLYMATEIIPDDPRLLDFVASISVPVTLDSEPSGATVYTKGYNYPQREWIKIGSTPLEEVPVALPARFRVEKPGYLPFEGAPIALDYTVRLFKETEVPRGMVYVKEGRARFGDSGDVLVGEFWIDKHEVTQREYQAFVDAGGYQNESFWKHGADRSAFVDSTGRPGPAEWELGRYPEGAGELPVGGVCWFEAMAYAEWAGKSLPTVFHWRRAAQQSIFSEILLWSNFDSNGPAPVGSYPGVGPTGTYDMAGNLREWCFNRTGKFRHILGGAWSEPNYLYRSTDATDPSDRSTINGFRCMRTEQPIPSAALAAIEYPVEDHRQTTTIDDALYEIVRQDFEYDERELNTEIEFIDDDQPYWRHELVTVDPAYGNERFRIHLYLPKNAQPPYQAVLYFPSSSALALTDGDRPSFPFAHFIPKSGRALIYPIFQATYDRKFDRRGPNDDRELKQQLGKEVQRTMDLLESRDDIDAQRVAYYGLSWGASEGPIMTAIEPRFKTSILLSGGLRRYDEDWPPGAMPQNFMPRSTLPTLVINGRDDFGAPVETNIQPMFDLLGTPAESKRLVLLEGGHVPSAPNEVIREILDWLDQQLGPVNSNPTR